jgi:hypothetical protein
MCLKHHAGMRDVHIIMCSPQLLLLLLLLLLA